MKFKIKAIIAIIGACFILGNSSKANAEFNIELGEDKDGNTIYAEESNSMSGENGRMIFKYHYRLPKLVRHVVKPDWFKGDYKIFGEYANFDIIITCGGLQRITVIDMRVFANTGKEVEVYRQDQGKAREFQRNAEKIITNHYCR